MTHQLPPLVLIDGGASTVPANVTSALRRWGVSRNRVVGGANAVSYQLFSGLSTLAPATRLFGADRYATSVPVNSAAFPDASDAYLAAGSSFAGGLTGGAVAGAKVSPMFLVRSICVPQAAIGQIVTWGVTSVSVLGGTAAIGSGAQTV